MLLSILVISRTEDLLSKMLTSISKATRLGNENIEILSLTYNFQLEFKKIFSLKTIKNCLKHLFYIVTDNIKNGISLIYKKILSFYHELFKLIFFNILIKDFNR